VLTARLLVPLPGQGASLHAAFLAVSPAPVATIDRFDLKKNARKIDKTVADN
jgi:hypothetical protein